MKHIHRSGFTLVELMVVIAIIGILAAALFPQMNQYLARSRDSARIQTAYKLSSFLVMYGVDFGLFPPVVENNQGGWDTDIDGSLLDALKNGGFQLTSPGQSSKIWGNPSGQPNFAYYNYPVGWTNGCDDTRGSYYVLGIPNLEGWIAPSNQLNRVGGGGSKEILSKSPGFWCKNEISNRDWGTEFEWVTGNYISGN